MVVVEDCVGFVELHFVCVCMCVCSCEVVVNYLSCSTSDAHGQLCLTVHVTCYRDSSATTCPPHLINGARHIHVTVPPRATLRNMS